MNERKKKIIETAMQLFGQKGYHSTSMQEIAENSGVSKGALYNHFSSKEELVLSIFKHYYNEIFRKIASVEQNTALTKREVFMEQLKIQLGEIYSHKDFFQMQMQEQAVQVNREVHQLLFTFRAQSLNWYRQRLLGVYGQTILPYIMDCVTILNGMLKEYFFYMIVDEKDIDIDYMVPFIMRRLDAVVNSFEKNEAPLLTENMMQNFIYIEEETKHQLHKKITSCLTEIKRTIINATIDAKTTEYVLSSLDAMHDELSRERQEIRPFIVEGILLYVRNQSLLDIGKQLEELSSLIHDYM